MTNKNPMKQIQLAFPEWLQGRVRRVEDVLDDLLPPADALPARLHEAMRYAVLGGGKRVRAALVYAAGQACPVSGSVLAVEASLDRAAAAVELIHAYSLVHDDLPCMDNDVLRRGKPTVHVKFGEADALLAGDALQALAFELLVPDGERVPAAVQARLVRLLARAAGGQGMAGGQAIDLASVGRRLAEAELREMHRLKTGALLQGSVEMGTACAGELPAEVLAGLRDYGAAIGLAFQVVDDILDVVADSATLGKTAGKDAAADKPTYVSLLGLDGARANAARLLDEALAALARTRLSDTAALRALAHMVVDRDR